jgi:D-proline reductase (dithiol) PrdB
VTCNQSVGLAARVLEEHGIATVCIMSRSDLAELVKAPRTLILRFPYGAPLGPPGDVATQLAILRDSLNLLASVTEPGAIVESGYKWRV